MAWMDAISDIIGRYAGMGGGTAPAPADPHQDYREIAQSAPPQVMADALAHTFRSDQTPSFAEMVSSLFQQSSPEQRAGLLNRLVGAAGPAALATVPALKELAGSAGRISPEQVQQIANQAQRVSPSVIDQVSGYYARHPDVVKALGGAAITLAIQRIVQRR
jgi:hypothetical protein